MVGRNVDLDLRRTITFNMVVCRHGEMGFGIARMKRFTFRYFLIFGRMAMPPISREPVNSACISARMRVGALMSSVVRAISQPSEYGKPRRVGGRFSSAIPVWRLKLAVASFFSSSSDTAVIFSSHAPVKSADLRILAMNSRRVSGMGISGVSNVAARGGPCVVVMMGIVAFGAGADVRVWRRGSERTMR